jgi:hypothetical protein
MFCACGILSACSLRLKPEEEFFGDTPIRGGVNGKGGAGATGGRHSDGGVVFGGTTSGGSVAEAGQGAEAGDGAAGTTSRGGSSGGSSGTPGGAAGSTGTADAGATAAGAAGGPGFDPDAGIVLHYAFDETTGEVVHDSNDASKDARIYGDGATWIAGRIAGGLRLPGGVSPSAGGGSGVGGTGGTAEAPPYVHLPNDILLPLSETTIACWYRWDGGAPGWQRVFDLGQDMPTWIYFSPDTVGGARAAMRNAASLPEHILDAIVAGRPAVATWAHVAVSWSATGFSVYINGGLRDDQMTSIENPGNATPADLLTTGQNWLGRSQFPADPYYTGMIDDFRIYDRALTQAEVIALYHLAPQLQ